MSYKTSNRVKSNSNPVNSGTKESEYDSFCSNISEQEAQINSQISARGQGNAGMLAIEPRIMLDAAGVETASEVAEQTALAQAEQWMQPAAQPVSDIEQIAFVVQEETLSERESTPHTNEIIFIDSTVENIAVILGNIASTTEVIILDSEQDGVEQIAATLEGRSGLDAIHIISHGRSGTLDLGNTKLTEATINGKHADEMAIIRNALSEDADLLIYGCNFGANARGASAIEALASATGADVAASEDLTGAEILGGDWDLEISTGDIEANAIAVDNWDHVLAPLVIDASGIQPSIDFPTSTDVGDTAIWAGAGSIGGQSIDIHATVISASPGVTVFFDTNADDPEVDIETGPGGGGEALIRWEIFEAGTDNIATGAPSITISDVDGIINPLTIETVIPELDGLISVTTGNNSAIDINTANGQLTASGTDNDLAGPLDPSFGAGGPTRDSAAVTFNWSERTSWDVTYRVDIADALRVFLHDGDGDFTFSGSTNTLSLSTLDLDGDDNSSAVNADYQDDYSLSDVPVAIADEDTSIIVDTGVNITGAIVTLTNIQTNDSLAIAGVAGTSGTVPGTSIGFNIAGGLVSLSGTASADDYETALEAIRFSNSDVGSALVDRVFETALTDSNSFNTNIATTTISVSAPPVNLAPSIDLDLVSTSDTPGSNGFTEIDFSGLGSESNPTITNNGNTEAVNGVGNGETALYENVGIIDGQAIDIRATVISTNGADPGFNIQGGDNANVNLGGGNQNTATVRWEVFLSGTTTPINGNFTVLINDLDNNGNNGTFESIEIAADSVDAYVLNDPNNNELFVDDTTVPGRLIVTPTASDPGRPGVLPQNTIQLTFTNTSSFEIFYNRNNEGANFGLDGNFTSGFFTNPQVTDTNPDFAAIFTEGDAPINVAAQTAEIDDMAEGDIERLDIEPGNISDGIFEIITFNGDAGASISLPLDGSDTSQQSLTVGGTDLFIQYNAGSSTFEITEQSGGIIPKGDLDTLIRAITYENTDENPVQGDRTLTFRLTDAGGAVSNDAVSTILVLPVNDDPIAANDDFTTDDITPINGNLITGDNDNGVDSDIDSSPLIISDVTVTTGGSSQVLTVGTQAVLNSGAIITVLADGTIDYDPNGFIGTETITYAVGDGDGGSDTGDVNLVVAASNIAPVAQDDAGGIHSEDAVPIVGNVLIDNGNGADSDADGDMLSVIGVAGGSGNTNTVVTLTSGATVTIDSLGNYTYDLNGAFDALSTGDTAMDSFTYTVSDGNGGTDTATVSFTIIGANDVPIVDLNGALPGTDYEAVFAEDTPGAPLANLLTFDAIVQDDEDNIAAIVIIPTLPLPNDGSAELFRIDSGALQLTIDLNTGVITAPNPLTFGGTTFSVSYNAGAIAIENVIAGTPLDSDDLQGFMRLLAYQNTDQNNTEGERAFEFQVIDPFSQTIATSTITVSRTNDAPVPTVIANPDGTVVEAGTGADPIPLVVSTSADFSDPGTIAVADLLAQLNITDAEQTEFGIGIISAPESSGRWQYLRTDIPGSVWTDFQLGDPDNLDSTPIPEGEALLMDPDALLRFIPNDGFSGTANIGFRIWDMSIGTASNPPSTILDDSGGVAPTATSSLSSTVFLAGTATDYDGDGVIDGTDLDDDNDGILDTVETPNDSIDFSNGLNFSNQPVQGGNGVYVGVSGTRLVTVNPGAGGDSSGNLRLGDNVTNNPPDYNDGDVYRLNFDRSVEVTISNMTLDIAGFDNVASGGDEWRIDATGGFTIFDPDNELNIQSIGANFVELRPNGNFGGGDGSWSIITNDPVTQVTFRVAGNQASAVNVAVTAVDTDGDGVFNHLDLDSDNDGISDLIESGQDFAIVDVNNDGVHDGGVNGTGVPIAASGGSDVTPVNSDTDSLPDFIDLDSDNDGIPDQIEAQPTADFQSLTNVNNASNFGVNDIGLFVPSNTDGDAELDFRDTDSDADTLLDSAESGLTPGADNNNDGIGDNIGASYGDGDGTLDDPQNDLANQAGDTSQVGYRENPTDTDSDGVFDLDDLDSDNDGILDSVEGLVSGSSVATYDFESIAGSDSETLVNGSGLLLGGASVTLTHTTTGNAVMTTDSISDSHFDGEFGVRIGHSGTASSPTDTLVSTFDFGEDVEQFSFNINDLDFGDHVTVNGYLDGVLVNLTAANFAFFSPTIVSSDGGNDFSASDTDSSSSDTRDGSVRISFNSPIDQLEIIYHDMIGSGTVTYAAFSAAVATDFGSRDTDGDGVFDYVDLDSDNDGISDLIESGQDHTAVDTNNDGVHDGGVNGSGIPTDANGGTGVTPVNTDTDGLADYIDLDSDNDGIPDQIEAQPTAGYQSLTHVNNLSNNGVSDQGLFVPENTYGDADFDFRDTNSDNDTVLDSAESGLTPGVDNNNDGIGDGIGASYGDGDGLINNPVGTLQDNDPSTQEVAFRENSAPIAQDDDVVTDEDSILSGSVLNDNINGADSDFDPEDMLTVTLVNGSVANVGTQITLASGALLTVNADGTFDYDPNGQFENLGIGDTASDSFTYEVSDGNGGTATATASVTVTGVADGPAIDLDIDDSTDTVADFTVIYTENDAAVGVVDTDFSITDPEDNITEMVIVLTNGEIGDTLQFPSGLPGGITATQVPGIALTAPGTQTLTFSGIAGTTTIADWNAVLSSVLFVPQTTDVHNPVASDRIITVQVSDEGNIQSNLATTTVEVVPVNDAPTLDLDDDNSGGLNAGNYAGTFTENGGAVPIHSEILISDLDNPNLDSATVTFTNPQADDQLVIDGVVVFDNGVVTAASGIANGVSYTVALVSGEAVITFSGSNTVAEYTDALELVAFNNTSDAPVTVDRAIEVVLSDGTDSSPTRISTISVMAVNDAPENTVTLGDQTGVDNALVSIATFGAFTDADGDTLAFSATNLPVGLSIDPATGLISGTVDNSASVGGPLGDGEYPVTVTVTDPFGETATDTFNLAISNPVPVVDTPLGAQSATDGAIVSITPAISDPDMDTLTYSSSPLPLGLTINPATGEISGVIDNSASLGGDDPVGAPGVYTITVTADDAEGGTITDTFVYTITNPDPVAVDDVAMGDEDNDQTGNVITDAVTGDADGMPDSDAVTVTDVDGIAVTVGNPAVINLTHGTLTLADTGDWTFEPNSVANQLSDTDPDAVETVTYTITDDDGATDTATLTITVAGVNDPVQVVDPNDPSTDPTNPAYDPTNPTVIADPDNLIPDVAATDGATPVDLDTSPYFGDAEGDTLTFSATDLPSGLMIDPVTGIISGMITPDASQNGNTAPGIYDVIVTATDPSGNMVTTTITYTITNLDPTAVDDVTMGDEDNDQTGNVLTDAVTGDADTPPDSDPVTVTDVNGTAVTAGSPAVINLTHGTLTLTDTGDWTFEPNSVANQLSDVDPDAVETVTYTIDDGNGGTDTATLTITVAGVNDPVQVVDPSDPSTDPTDPTYDPTNPTVIADPDNLIPDVAATDGETPTNILAGDYFADAEGDTLVFSATDLPPGLMIDPVTGIISGTIAPDASQNGNTAPGIYDVVITAEDPQGNMVTTTVTYTITNLDPVAVDDAVMADEDAPVISGNVITDAVTGDADTAPDSDPLMISLADQGGNPITLGVPFTVTGGGMLTLNDDGSYSFDPGTSYNGLGDGESEVETINYTVDDGNGGTDTATLTFTITGSNDAPVVVDPMNPGPDPENPIAADPNTIIPVQNVEDGEDFSAMPLVDVSDYAIDPDGDPLVFTTTDTLPTGLTLNPDGTVTGVIDPSASQGGSNSDGMYPITITIDDGTTTTTISLTLDVANPVPVAQDDDITTDEDGMPAGNVFADNGNGIDTDTLPDSDPLTVSQVEGDPLNVGMPADGSNGGAFTINADGTYSFDPGVDFQDLDVGEQRTTSISYQVSDGDGGFDTATVEVTVSGTNDAPVVIDPEAPFPNPNDPPSASDPDNIIPDVAAEDSSAITPVDVSLYFVDVDGEPLVYEFDPADPDVPVWLTIDPATGVISGTPPSDASTGGANNDGIYSLTVMVTDPDGASVTTVVNFVVTNPPPVVTESIEEQMETVGLLVELDVSDSFNDPDGDTLSFSATGLPAGLTIDPVTGTISGMLDPAAVGDAPDGDGIYTVIVTADDGQGGVISTSFTFTALDEVTIDPGQSRLPLETNASGDLPFDVGTGEPIILDALADISAEMEELRRAAELDQQGNVFDSYLGGQGQVLTSSGNITVQTLIHQDFVYLEIRNDEQQNDWQVIGDDSSPSQWFRSSGNNLFVALGSAQESSTIVELMHSDDETKVKLLVDLKSGHFEILDIVEPVEQTNFNGFTNQIRDLHEASETQTQALINAL